MEFRDKTYIKELLELYMEGGTTLEQEWELREYFSAGDVPEEFLYAKAMFGYFMAAAAEECEKDVVFDEMKACDTNEQFPAKRRTKTMRIIYAVAATAACVAAALVIFLKPVPADPVYCYINGYPVHDVETASRQVRMAVRVMEGGMAVTAEKLAALESVREPMEKVKKITDFISTFDYQEHFLNNY